MLDVGAFVLFRGRVAMLCDELMAGGLARTAAHVSPEQQRKRKMDHAVPLKYAANVSG